jgi:hypothetical protein
MFACADTHKENPSGTGIKCKCKSRSVLIALLKEFYIKGMKLQMEDGFIEWVQVQPDTPNPLQCYHCFEFGKHVAVNCTNLDRLCE